LERKLASLFLCMQTVLHVSKYAIQKIIELRDILYFSKVLSFETIKEVLVKQKVDLDPGIFQEIGNALFETNVIQQTTSVKGSLSSDYRRNLFFKEHFSVVEPTEYLYDRTRKNHFVYVSIYQALERLLRHPALLDKISFRQQSFRGHFESFQDGCYYKQNILLGESNLTISLGLYIDEFEACNPLGTSRKIHKIVAVYWVLLNLPAKYRSGLQSIQLAVLGKKDYVSLFGYDKFLDPLIKDVKCLEQTGIFVPALDQNLKGTIFCVCADNLGAHSLAGFQESFNTEKCCRFCLISKNEIKSTEVILTFKMLLRIYISDANVRRFLLIEVPTSVDQLKTLLEEKLQLKKGFELQFEDPDFDNALCNLHSIDELPAEKAVLRVVWAIEPSSSVQDISDASSVSSLDTASPTNLRSVAQWPSPFDVPTFSLDVELRLQKANEIYKETKKPLNVRRDMKSEILNKLAQTIFEIKAYPDACEIESVASALVQKHPCLTEPGAGSGWDGWMMSIKFKLGNYRAKLRDAGCSEVNINRKRERGQVEGLKGRMKKSKRAEVNFLPDHPAGQSDESLEKERVSIVEETRKKRIDATLVRQKMEATFSLRRKEVVEVEPLVEEIRERWPALFYEDEVSDHII
ncbi:hypothetical protein AMEX_G9499, partial [Astyanax mexicanus]